MENSQLANDVKRLTASLGSLPEPVVQPTFIVVSGLPGTGKSYFSIKLAERLPLVILESDFLRKILFSPPSYSPEESARLFQAIHRLIKKLLQKGIPLVLDATNLSERYREYLYSIAEHLGVRLVLVRVEAPPQVVRQRLQARVTNSADNSDAGWLTYQRMKPIARAIGRQHYAVDTSRDITPVLDRIIKEVMR